MKKAIMVAVFSLLLIVLVRVPIAAQTLKTVKVTIPRNTISMLNYPGARDAGIFRKHGIDIQIDARGFKGFMASFPSRETLVGTPSGLASIARMNQGLDIVIIGGGLTVMQRVVVPKGSPIRSLSDLRGKKFGTFSSAAGSFKTLRTVGLEGFGIDLIKETKVVVAPPPVLMALLDKGEIDAMWNVSSFTIRAASQPSKYRLVFTPDDYWKERTGLPLLWSAPIVAWRDWIQQDPQRAKGMVAALHESYQWLRENSDAAIKKYGVLAAVKTPAEAKVYKRWLKEKRFFLDRWDSHVIDVQWKFLEIAKRVGVLSKVPSKEKHTMVLR